MTAFTLVSLLLVLILVVMEDGLVHDKVVGIKVSEL